MAGDYETEVTQAVASRLLGVSRQAVSQRLAKGGMRDLRLATLHRIAADAGDESAVERIEEAAGGPPAREERRVDWKLVLDREKAMKARLDRRELQRQLVRRAAVERTYAELAVQVRDKLRQIPAKLAAKLAAENDPRMCREIVAQAIDKALVDLAGAAPIPSESGFGSSQA